MYKRQHDEGEAGWNQRFRIDLPSGAQPGKHLLAVRVLDRTLKGGIWKPVKVAARKR